MKTFYQFQENIAISVAKKSGSKLIPALMTGIGAAGTIMQSKKRKISDMSDDEIARKGPGDQLANVPKRKRDIFRKGLKDLIKPRFGETEKFKAGGAGAKGRYYSPETNKNVKVVKDIMKKRAKEGDSYAKRFMQNMKDKRAKNKKIDDNLAK